MSKIKSRYIQIEPSSEKEANIKYEAPDGKIYYFKIADDTNKRK